VSKDTDGKDWSPQAGDDGTWVLAARGGDLAAFDKLVVRYQKQATSVAYRLLNNLDDAMEVTQDAFLRAYEKIATLDTPERFGPWLMRIVSNLALNRRRWRSLRKTVSLEPSGNEGDEDRGGGYADPSAVMPEQEASAKDVQRILADAIAELPEMQRQALVMFCIEQMPQKDIAQALDCSVEAVKWHVFTARKKLKERFKDYL
jgi:RNA polymerase sigma-70 factor, ECF subfamily